MNDWSGPEAKARDALEQISDALLKVSASMEGGDWSSANAAVHMAKALMADLVAAVAAQANEPSSGHAWIDGPRVPS